MSGGPRPPLPPPPPADIGIVAALPIEVGPLLARLTHVRKYAGPRFTITEGELGGKLIALVLTGMGRPRAQRGAELLLDGHRPRWLVSAGFAGALDPTLERNQIVLPDRVVNLEGGSFAIDLSVPPEARAQGLRSGTLVTVDDVVRTAVEKAALRQKTGAHVVDMETSAIAALCGNRGVRFLPVRVVSDDARSDLPPEILAIVGRSGGLRLGATVGALWKRPSSVKDLLRLRQHAVEAAERLASFLEGSLTRLS
jgi:adenosylhomocysteine nucleosidase